MIFRYLGLDKLNFYSSFDENFGYRKIEVILPDLPEKDVEDPELLKNYTAAMSVSKHGYHYSSISNLLLTLYHLTLCEQKKFLISIFPTYNQDFCFFFSKRVDF